MTEERICALLSLLLLVPGHHHHVELKKIKHLVARVAPSWISQPQSAASPCHILLMSQVWTSIPLNEFAIMFLGSALETKRLSRLPPRLS